VIEFTFIDWPTTGLCNPYHSCLIFRRSSALICYWKQAILRDLWFFCFLDKRHLYLRLFCNPHFHTFSNSLFASDLLVSEITRSIQWLVYRLDDRETEFQSPIREWNFFLSVASRSAQGCDHTLVQWLRGGFFYPALKKFTTGRRDWEFVELYLHSPFVLWRIMSGNLMCAVFIVSFIFFVTDSLQSRNSFLSPCHQSCQ
jgi:hypothetical protein